MISLTKEFKRRLDKHPLKTNGRLDNLGLISLVKEATGFQFKLLLCSSFEDKTPANEICGCAGGRYSSGLRESSTEWWPL